MLSVIIYLSENSDQRTWRDMRKSVSIALVSALLLLTSCGKGPTNAADWNAYVQGYLDAYFVAHPDYAVVEGRHEFDGKLPDFSSQGLAREIASARSPAASPDVCRHCS